jgi:uncharacterized Zn-finger protein
MRIHNGEKPFKCNFADCDMSFTTQGHLTDHRRRHSGERPYLCETCGEKFMRSSTLKIHMRRHTGEKPYRCDKCDRAFSESGNLRTHLKIHVGHILHIHSIWYKCYNPCMPIRRMERPALLERKAGDCMVEAVVYHPRLSLQFQVQGTVGLSKLLKRDSKS